MVGIEIEVVVVVFVPAWLLFVFAVLLSVVVMLVVELVLLVPVGSP